MLDALEPPSPGIHPASRAGRKLLLVKSLRSGMSDNARCLADVLGPWQQPEWNSGLIEECRRAWNIPFFELTNGQLAMLLRQEFAIADLLPIARERIRSGVDDDTELYSGELQSAVESATKRA